MPPLFLFVISYVKGGFDALGIWMGCDSCYSTSTPLDPCSTSSSHRRSVRSETLAFQVQIPRISSRSALAGCGWASMRHPDYCGVWTPGGYFRVRTSFFHCGDIDILDAHSNIFSFGPLSRFLLSPIGQWTRAVCSTNAEVRGTLHAVCLSETQFSTSLVKLMVPSPVLQHAPRRLFFRCSCERWHHL